MDNLRNFIQERKTLLSFLLLVAIFIYGKNAAPVGVVKHAADEGSIPSPTEQPSITPTLTPTATAPPGQRPSGPAATTLPTATPTPNPKPTSSIFDFFYPGATQISFDGDTLVLESSDDPDRITEWYKDKLNSLGMSAKSYVVTKTNGNVLNKLVADNGEREIRVEITKSKKQDMTKIVVTIHSS